MSVTLCKHFSKTLHKKHQGVLLWPTLWSCALACAGRMEADALRRGLFELDAVSRKVSMECKLMKVTLGVGNSLGANQAW